MSYVVLARRWRPMKFEEVVAQSHVTTTLINAIKKDRLASAYLLCGPRGVGKTTTARIFAKAINCEKGPTPTPCNECSSCTEITGSRSLDVFEIDGASNRGIDEVRTLRENLRYAATRGKYKIYIIDEVHMLTTEAFNALLKTLEEPPAKVLFIFATTEPHKVPATILSRCQRYDFRRIPLNDIVQQLQNICTSEKINIDEKSLFLIARKSDGSLRDSQSLLDQAVSFCGQEIKIKEMSELLGIIDQELFFESSDCISNKDVVVGLQLVEKIFNHGYDMAEFLNGLAEHFRNMLIVRATDNLDLLEGMETYGEKYKEAAQSFSETDLLRLIQLATDTAYQVKRSSNPKLLLEMLIVKMIKMGKSVELDDLLSNLNNLESASESKSETSTKIVNKSEQPQVKTEPVEITQEKPVVKDGNGDYKAPQKNPGNQNPEPPDMNAVVSLEKIKNDWSEIIDAVKSKKIHLGSFLNEGYPTGVHDGTLEISFGKENGFHINTIKQNRQLIQEIILEKTGFKLKINCKTNESEEFNKAPKEQRVDDEPEVQEIKEIKVQEVADDKNTLQIPIVKKVIELFDGEIISSKQVKKF